MKQTASNPLYAELSYLNRSFCQWPEKSFLWIHWEFVPSWCLQSQAKTGTPTQLGRFEGINLQWSPTDKLYSKIKTKINNICIYFAYILGSKDVKARRHVTAGLLRDMTEEHSWTFTHFILLTADRVPTIDLIQFHALAKHQIFAKNLIKHLRWEALQIQLESFLSAPQCTNSKRLVGYHHSHSCYHLKVVNQRLVLE